MQSTQDVWRLKRAQPNEMNEAKVLKTTPGIEFYSSANQCWQLQARSGAPTLMHPGDRHVSILFNKNTPKTEGRRKRPPTSERRPISIHAHSPPRLGAFSRWRFPSGGQRRTLLTGGRSFLSASEGVKASWNTRAAAPPERGLSKGWGGGGRRVASSACSLSVLLFTRYITQDGNRTGTSPRRHRKHNVTSAVCGLAPAPAAFTVH